MADESVIASSTRQASQDSVRAAIQAAYSATQAALIARLGSVSDAEDAMQEAVLKAWKRWPETGIPERPVAWLIVSGSNAFRDQYRRGARFDLCADPASAVPLSTAAGGEAVDVGSDEDVLRLIFMCCHPGIAVENQLALSLKMLMGFSPEEIAKALLISPKTLEQRITRAKRKIAASGISLALPRADSLPLRLSSVRQSLYLIFNEGYHSVGEELINRELCRQAIQLTRALCRGFPDPENFGLLSLMLFHDARAAARTGKEGELITLDTQNRMLWNRAQIEEADVLLQKALRRAEVGVYQLQAAIAGLHSLAKTARQTDWRQIVGLYRRLFREQASAVIGLNYAVALMMAGQLGDAERMLLAFREQLQDYSPYYAAVAKLSTLTGREAEAGAALEQAAALTGSLGERRHYQLQLAALNELGR